MNKLLIPFIGLIFFVISCAQTQSVDSNRQVSSEEKTKTDLADEQYAKNVEILDSIPITEGYEKKNRKELKMTDALKEIFSKIAKESSEKFGDHKLRRATHAKGICYNGITKIHSIQELKELKYSDEIIRNIQAGLFKEADELSTFIRFANAKGDVNPDSVGDVRALSFSIDTEGKLVDSSGENRLDIMMNSSPMFAVNNITEFFHLMKFARFADGDRSYTPNLFYLRPTFRAQKLLGEYERPNIESWSTTNYWANLPFIHGLKSDDSPKNIVKYKAEPCEENQTYPVDIDKKKDAYLSEDLNARLNQGPLCFKLKVQIYDKNKLRESSEGKQRKWISNVDWIENGGAHWKESVLPFYEIAKIQIDQSQQPLPSCDNYYINTRLHTPAEHRPIGSLARVRTYVEEFSRYLRQYPRD